MGIQRGLRNDLRHIFFSLILHPSVLSLCDIARHPSPNNEKYAYIMVNGVFHSLIHYSIENYFIYIIAVVAVVGAVDSH